MSSAPRRLPPASVNTAHRPWYLDGLCAFAFLTVALCLSKPVRNLFGPIAALFFLFINSGLGWHFARLAWAGLLERRSNSR